MREDETTKNLQEVDQIGKEYPKIFTYGSKIDNEVKAAQRSWKDVGNKMKHSLDSKVTF